MAREVVKYEYLQKSKVSIFCLLLKWTSKYLMMKYIDIVIAFLVTTSNTSQKIGIHSANIICIVPIINRKNVPIHPNSHNTRFYFVLIFYILLLSLLMYLLKWFLNESYHFFFNSFDIYDKGHKFNGLININIQFHATLKSFRSSTCKSNITNQIILF